MADSRLVERVDPNQHLPDGQEDLSVRETAYRRQSSLQIVSVDEFVDDVEVLGAVDELNQFDEAWMVKLHGSFNLVRRQSLMHLVLQR